MSSNLLINEPPLQVLPTLAVYVGLNEAIFLQQLHYWLQIEAMGKVGKDGRKYIHNTISEWERQFPFWSGNAIRRITKNLIDDGLLICRSDMNLKGYDKTLWYTINREALAALAGPVARISLKNDKRAAAIAVRYEDDEEEETAVSDPAPAAVLPSNATSTPLQNVTPPLQNVTPMTPLQNVHDPLTFCNGGSVEKALQNVSTNTRDTETTSETTYDACANGDPANFNGLWNAEDVAAAAGEFEAADQPAPRARLAADQPAQPDPLADAYWQTAVRLVDRWQERLRIRRRLFPDKENDRTGYFDPALVMVAEFGGDEDAVWQAVVEEHERLLSANLYNVNKLSAVQTGVLGKRMQASLPPKPEKQTANGRGPAPIPAIDTSQYPVQQYGA